MENLTFLDFSVLKILLLKKCIKNISVNVLVLKILVLKF